MRMSNNNQTALTNVELLLKQVQKMKIKIDIGTRATLGRGTDVTVQGTLFQEATMKHKYDIDMYLVAMDLMAEMKLLTDFDPNLHDQMKALEDENNLYFGYENLQGSKE